MARPIIKRLDIVMKNPVKTRKITYTLGIFKPLFQISPLDPLYNPKYPTTKDDLIDINSGSENAGFLTYFSPVRKWRAYM